jgi:hypothetical protein
MGSKNVSIMGLATFDVLPKSLCTESSTHFRTNSYRSAMGKTKDNLSFPALKKLPISSAYKQEKADV